MKRIELVQFNKEFLQRLKEAGVKLDDYKYCELYQRYQELSILYKSRKEVILTLTQEFNLTDRQIYNILKHLETPVKHYG